MITFIEYNNVGAITDEAAVTVTSAGVSYTITAGKKGVSLQNIGDKTLWYGGPSVNTADRGNILYQRQTIVYKNVKKTFKIYFQTAIGEETKVGVVTHD